MNNNTQRKSQAKLLRVFRKIHRTTGAALFIFFFFVSITGLLLGWKKQSGGIIQAKTHKGSSSNLEDWLPIDSLYRNAVAYLHDSVDASLSSKLDRIDIRQNKGSVKFIFEDHFWGLQLDGATGALLHVEQRRSDFIEKIHDGSILDFYFDTSAEQFKLIYTTVIGLALLVFTITGFWLWYGPKQMRATTKAATGK